MATVTSIEWTERASNPVTGCSKVSQGCKHCYAERIAERFWGERPFTAVQCHPERLAHPELDGRTYDEFPTRVTPLRAALASEVQARKSFSGAISRPYTWLTRQRLGLALRDFTIDDVEFGRDFAVEDAKAA